MPRRQLKTIIIWLALTILVKYVELAVIYYYQIYYRGNYTLAAKQVILKTKGFPVYANDFVATGLSVTAEIDRLIYPIPPLKAVKFAKEKNYFIINDKIEPELGRLYKQIKLGKQGAAIIYYVKERRVILISHYNFMKAITKQFSRFFIVGAISALIQFSILISFVEFLFIKPILASTFGYIVGALINYTLNHYFSFKSSLSHKKALVRFSLNSLFGLFFNLLLMKIFLIYYSYILSQILASGVILFWNFLVHRYWTFGPTKHSL